MQKITIDKNSLPDTLSEKEIFRRHSYVAFLLHLVIFIRGWLHQSRLYIERLAIVLVSRRRQRGWLMHRFVMVILNAGISYLINNIYVNAGIFTCCLQKASMFLTKITRISKNHYKIFLKILQASDLIWDRRYRCQHP